MRISIASPIPDMGSMPGPSRPGWGPAGSYDFQFEVTGAVTIKAQPAAAGTFTIKWPNGTEQTTAGSNSIPAPDSTAGVVSINKKTDTTYCDEFAIVGGQTNVSQVLSWGNNDWSNMAGAFRDCTNLTELPPASNIFKAGSASLSQFIYGCTGLTELDMTGWDLGSGTGTNLYYFAFNCTNLEKIIFKNKDVKLSASTPRSFQGVGTNVTNGCEFDMEGLNFTGTCNDMNTWFITARAKVGSNFSNWRFNQSVNNLSLVGLFNQIKFVDTSAILNVSGWTDCNAINLSSMFSSAGGASSATPIDAINITGLRTNDTTTMYRMFRSSKMSRIIGLNDLVSNSLTGNGAVEMFSYTERLLLKNPSVTPTENLSNSFGSNWSITSVSNMFERLNEQGNNYNEWSYPPNLTGFNLSGVTNYAGFSVYNRLSHPYDLSPVTFPTSAISLQGSLSNHSFPPTSDFTFDFSNVTINVSNFQTTFQNNQCNRYKFGSNVNFSNNTTFQQTFKYSGMPPLLSNGDPSYRQIRVEFPTNANFGSVTTMSGMFEGQYGGYSNEVPFTNCQADNFIRIIYGTAFSNNLTVDLLNSQVTEAPSVVQSKLQELTTGLGGWSVTVNTTDATMPFEYTGPFQTGNDITPTINTSGGVFSSSDVTVNEDTGTFNTSTAVNATIRYTLPNGCYNEQVLNVVPPFTPFKFRVTGPISIKAQPAVAGQSFTIDWGDGSTPISTTGGTSIASNFTTAGTYDVQINAESDATYCDEFAIVSGQTNVTQVLDWGETAWTNLTSAFSGCNSLTDISTTSLITGSSCVLTSAFQNCTSLAEANISSWDMTNAARIDQMFDACTGLQVFQASNLNLNHTSKWWLRGTGTAVTNGCEYRLNGLNITATSYAASNMTDLFTGIKINPSSSFANISWPSVTHVTATFSGSSITGVNSTLDCSGWTNYNSASFPYFGSLTATEGGTSNMKINITNLSVSSVTSFNRSFLASNVSEIIGLNSLGASAGITNMEFAFYLCGFLSFSNSNFSNAFINSFSLTSNPTQAFRGVGASLSSGSAPPNLGSLNISGVSALTQMFQSAKFSSAPDFSNVVMSTTNPYDLNNCFSGMAILDTSNIDSLFAKTFKVSSFSSTFSSCQISSVTIGNNVDLSTCTTFNRAFLSASTISDVSFPTNADFSGVTTSTNWQYMFLSGPTLSTCSVDNFIRRLHATALSYGLVINFNNAATTETPSVVSSKVADLEAAGWTITDNTTDATIPFEYGVVLEPDTNITPTNNTGSAFTGIFSSTNSNIAVNSTTGVINTPNLGNTTIRYTLPDGCYTEQAITIATQFLSFEIDTSLYDPTDLTQSFGFIHVNGQSNPLTQPTPSPWTGSIDVDWGDTTSETLTPSDSTGTSQRANFNHTYSTGGTYTIKVNFANAYSSSTDATILEITGFASTGGNGTSESLKRQRITKVNTFGNTIRIASTKYLTYSPNYALFQGLTNCTQLPVDNFSIYSGYTDSNWYLDTFANCEKITSAKVGELFTMNASPVTYTQGGGRYVDWVENCYLLETLELKNVNLGRGHGAYIDATSQNCGRDVSVGTQVTIDNINVTDVSTTTYGGHFMQQLGFNNANNKIHKDFVCKNIIISNYAPTTAGVGINPMMLGNATVLANNSDDVSINMTNWRMADNSPLAIGDNAFKFKPNIQDISSGSARTSGWEVDLTSTSQWKLSGSYQNKFSYLPSATVKIIGTANWDITGVTSWHIWCWSGTTTSTIIDMDISGWEVWNTATMNYFINNAKILTSKYDAALIAWNNNVPGSAAAVNIRLGTSNYTEGGAAEAARTSLIETHGWTISDGGPA